MAELTQWTQAVLPPADPAASPGTRLAVVGASLGGFYADCIARHSPCRAVLLNPVVAPARDLARHIGAQRAFHNPAESFYFDARYVEELRQLQGPAPARKDAILVIMAQGDEVLDWREMQARYTGCQQRVLPGADHGLSHFDRLLPDVLAHLGLPI